MNKKTDPEDEPMYVKRGQLRTRRPLTPKAKLKAAKKLKAKTTLKKHSSAKKPHKKSIPKLKEELDILFGRFIKYRDGQMVDGQWVIHCITCHKPFVYRDKDGKRYTVIQAGHFMSRGLGATRYEPRNVNGQCSYCVTPDTRVLMADFTWKEIGQVKIGDKLIGFDENRTPNSYRKYRTTTVTSLSRKTSPVYEVSLINGDKVKTTAEHKWLARYGKTSSFRWIETQKLWVDSKNLLGHHIQGAGKQHTYSTVCKPFEVVEQEKSYESGWLAGMLDADGHITQQLVKDKRTPGKNWWGLRIGISQGDGKIADRIQRELVRLSGNEALVKAQISTTIYNKHGKPYSSKGVVSYLVTGTNVDKIQFLQRLRPEKLEKVDPNKLGKVKSQFDTQISGIKSIGEQEVVVMETDSHTFIAEGYAMHNCNKWLAGDQYRHGLEVDKKFGVGTASALYELAHTDYKFKREWLLEQIEYYKNAIAKYEQLW